MDHKQVLAEAARLLSDRGQQYGAVQESFRRAAAIASLKLGFEILPFEVCVILESVKDARRAYDHTKLDSYVDGINYAAFAAEFAEAYNPQPFHVRKGEPPKVSENPSLKDRAPLSDVLKKVDEAIAEEISGAKQ